MSPEDYIRELIRRVPGIVKDAMDPQIIQAELAVDISDNMADNVPNPVYPRAGGKTLQLVTNKLFRAATVYKAPGNVSKTTGSGTSFEFQWGIDLEVVPYARIHEFGGTINHPGGTPYFIGKDGRAKFVKKANGAGLPKTKPHPIEIPARPYITPALETFSGGNKTVNAANFTASPNGFARVINEIYLRLSLIS